MKDSPRTEELKAVTAAPTNGTPHEANMSEGKLSIKSPIAQALLGKNEGDEVEVKVPVGVLKLRIESVTR